VALSSARNGADPPLRVAVPSSTRLDCSADRVAALKAPIFWKTGRPPGLSHVWSQEAVPGRAAGPKEAARAGSATGMQPMPLSPPVTARHATFGGCSAADHCIRNEEVAAQRGSWPVMGPLATEVGICGQIDRNRLVIQGDLATDR